MEFYKEKFIEIRKKSGLKVTAIIDKIEIRRSTLWNWEKGKTVPSETAVRELADFLGVKVSEISDLPDFNKETDNQFFKADFSWHDFNSGNIGNELIIQQEKALNKMRSINYELNQVWNIVQGMMHAIQAVIYIKDANNKYITVNNAFKNNLSLFKNYNAHGKTDYDFFSVSEAKANEAQDMEVLQTGKDIKNIEGYIIGTRKKKWGIASKHLIKNNDGKTSGLVAIILDTTENRKLNEIRDLLENAINHSTDAFTIRKLKNKQIEFASQGKIPFSGYTTDYFLGKSGYEFWLNLLKPEDRKKEEKYYRTEQFPNERIYEILHKNGGTVWVKLSSYITSYNYAKYLCTLIKVISKTKESTEINHKKNIEVAQKKERTLIAQKMFKSGYSKEEIFKLTDIDIL